MVEKTVLEQKKRFSESLLWQLQTDAYAQFGISAWSEKGVPFYLTSNPFTAAKYSCIVTSFLRDCLDPNGATPINPEEPITIVDLGAGTGRFGYLFLKEILPVLQHLPMQGAKIRYILTDLVEENIQFWHEHPYFQPYLKEGLLDFAHYQHDLHDQPLHLLYSKQILSKESQDNPLVLIGNYFFDTIPQDLFRVRDGVLEEGRITLSTSLKTPDLHNPELIETIACDYEYFPIEDVQSIYPNQPHLSELLRLYSDKFTNTTFTIPVGAFQALDYFNDMSGGRFLMIAGDQGDCTEEQIEERGDPKIDRHGTFSLAVSYHAIAHYFRLQGGAAMHTRFPDPFFVNMVGIMGGELKRFPNTHCAFHHHFNHFEPKDYWTLVSSVDAKWESPPLNFILDLVKLGCWDPTIFYTFFSKIRKQLNQASKKEKKELASAIHLAWDQFFPISPTESDFIMNLGVLFYEMHQHSDALLFFQRAFDLDQNNKQALNNMGACYLALQDPQSALECFEKAKQ